MCTWKFGVACKNVGIQALLSIISSKNYPFNKTVSFFNICNIYFSILVIAQRGYVSPVSITKSSVNGFGGDKNILIYVRDIFDHTLFSNLFFHSQEFI